MLKLLASNPSLVANVANHRNWRGVKDIQRQLMAALWQRSGLGGCIASYRVTLWHLGNNYRKWSIMRYDDFNRLIYDLIIFNHLVIIATYCYWFPLSSNLGSWNILEPLEKLRRGMIYMEPESLGRDLGEFEPHDSRSRLGEINQKMVC